MVTKCINIPSRQEMNTTVMAKVTLLPFALLLASDLPKVQTFSKVKFSD
jgi:hypothetical protein